MRGLPIRIRLTLLSALLMAIAISVTGAALYYRLEYSLDVAYGEDLEHQFSTVAAVLENSGPDGLAQYPTLLGGRLVGQPGEELAQILGPDGTLLGSPPSITHSLLPPGALELARRQRLETEMTPEGGDHIFRLLAATVDTPAGEVVLVAARSLEDRQEALAGMIAQFSLWGPLTVLMSSLLAYVLAGAALRPVEAMRREAEAISVADLEARLPVPSSNDEIASLGSTLNEMLDRLESSIQHERAFLADASHDLRTPLSLLKIELELALRQPRSAEELLGAVQSAACETDRLVALADDLLILASADQGSLPLHRARLSVVEVTESVVSEFRERAEREQRPLAVRGSTGLEIEADKSRLEQALRNLVENSLRYGEGLIEVCVERRGNEVRLHVRDEGPGFALDFLPRAFDRFTRADPARTGEGSGLGLAIAQAIAESHGGSAGVGNRGTGGADVWLAFPAYPAL